MAIKKKPKKKGAKIVVKPLTKMETYRTLADKTGLARKDVVAVCDALTDVMVKSVKKHGTYNFLGLMKMTLVKKPAVRGGKMVRNPFTGEMVKQKPKPASRTVRVRPLKAVKDRL
ncbi:HU family DNA-binding protein [Candidatus Eisenbacteria bacterium]|uniref:HU family DNA-binding protein n=1 Tax=Eiseniibacteriota bacterium TaxID=2212470 RepID=A0ABV6YL52_UNCEI